MAKTNKELVKEVKELKIKLKEALLEVKGRNQHQSITEVILPDKGFSIVKIEDEYKLVEIAFDKLTKAAKVVNIEDASNNNKNLSLAVFRGQQYLIEVVIKDATK